jgi:hypothetical protein
LIQFLDQINLQPDRRRQRKTGGFGWTGGESRLSKMK